MGSVLPAADVGEKSQGLARECGLFAELEESSFLGSPEELETDLAPTGVVSKECSQGPGRRRGPATPQFFHCS